MSNPVSNTPREGHRPAHLFNFGGKKSWGRKRRWLYKSCWRTALPALTILLEMPPPVSETRPWNGRHVCVGRSCFDWASRSRHTCIIRTKNICMHVNQSRDDTYIVITRVWPLNAFKFTFDIQMWFWPSYFWCSDEGSMFKFPFDIQMWVRPWRMDTKSLLSNGFSTYKFDIDMDQRRPDFTYGSNTSTGSGVITG